MLSTGIFADSESGGNSKTVLCARSAEYLLQPSLTESAIDISSHSVTEDEAAFKVNITDEFENKNLVLRYEMHVFPDDNLYLDSTTEDYAESVRNDFFVNNSSNVIEVHFKNSEAVLSQDKNFVTIPASLRSDNSFPVREKNSLRSDNSFPVREKNSLADLKDMEELIDLFVKPSETEQELEEEEPLFSLVDVYSPDETLETSLFPLTMSTTSSCISYGSDHNICSLFTDCNYGNSIPGHISNEKKTALDYNFCNSLSRDSATAVSGVALNQLEIDCDCGLTLELQCREHGQCALRGKPLKKQKKSCIKQKTVCSESKMLSVSEMQNSSSCFEELSKIEREVSVCSPSQKVSKQLQWAASGNGYFSEFAKFVQSICNSCPSAVQVCDGPHERSTGCSIIHTAEHQNSENYVLERQSNQNFVKSESNKDSQNCLTNLSVIRKQTSSRRSIQKPVCACCLKLGNNSSRVKVKISGKKQSLPAKQQGSFKDTKKSRRHLQDTIAVHAHMTQLEQLHRLQRKLFRLLHSLFPFLASWQYIKPHSHALELLIDEITDSLKDSTCSRKAKVWWPCCPTVTLCSFPAQCLESLKQKAAVLLSLLIPSLHVSNKDLCQLETVIDLLILSNRNSGCSEQF